MRISSVKLKNFKRFTDLSIENLHQDAKLVLLIGSNGAGKSSVFDAFEVANHAAKQEGYDPVYYQKKKGEKFEATITFDKADYNVSIADHPVRPTLNASLFYGRTSFRQVPRLTRTSTGQGGGQINFERDSDRPRQFIDHDLRFENDIEKISQQILREIFRDKVSAEQIQKSYIEPINTAFEHIFGNSNGTKLALIDIIPPLDGNIAQINFKKGESEIHYNFLSAGEKEIVNILFNLLVRREQYNDSIYFLDEIDLHLNTKLQYNLLKEITENWIPGNCQLWTASHSLGFIEYAKQSDNAVIIDFDDLDFDLPRILTPEPKERPEIYDVAVGRDFLPALFQNMDIYFVENKDKDYYASIGILNAVFVSDNNRNNVYHKVKATDYKGIVDRDFLSDDDISEIRRQYPNLFILNYYSIENYFYHPDNLEQYHIDRNTPFDKEQYIVDLTNAKNEAKSAIIPTLALKRTEYPYFGEPEFNNNPLQNRFKNKGENEGQSTIVASYLNSNDLEQYYKSLPMKSYCTNLVQRQNISKTSLAKTTWFKQQIESLLE